MIIYFISLNSKIKIQLKSFKTVYYLKKKLILYVIKEMNENVNSTYVSIDYILFVILLIIDFTKKINLFTAYLYLKIIN